MPESEERGIAVMRGVTANDNPGSEPAPDAIRGPGQAAGRRRGSIPPS